MSRPDITPAQLVAFVPILASLLRAFGVYDLGPDQQQALQDAVTFAIGLVGADAIIRLGRNLAVRHKGDTGEPGPTGPIGYTGADGAPADTERL